MPDVPHRALVPTGCRPAPRAQHWTMGLLRLMVGKPVIATAERDTWLCNRVSHVASIPIRWRRQNAWDECCNRDAPTAWTGIVGIVSAESVKQSDVPKNEVIAHAGLIGKRVSDLLSNGWRASLHSKSEAG